MLGSPRLTLIQVRGVKSVALIPWRATARFDARSGGRGARNRQPSSHAINQASQTAASTGQTTDSAKPIFSCDPAISSGLGWLAGRTILGWMAVAIAM